MDRRNFLTLSSKLAASAVFPASIVSCGGSVNAPAESAEDLSTISVIDSELSQIKNLQTEVESLNTDLLSVFDNTFSTVSSKATFALKSKTVLESAVAEFFETRNPSLPVAHYLVTSGSGNIWENAISAHQLSYQQYSHQLTKLIAAFRLFDAKNNADSGAQSGSDGKASAKQAARLFLTTDAAALIDKLDAYIQSLADGNFSAGLLDFIAAVLTAFYNMMQEVVSTDKIKALAYSFLIYLSIDQLLDSIIQQTTTNLDFGNEENIILSLAKVSIASVSLLALTDINDLQDIPSSPDDQTSAEVDFISAFLAANGVISKLSQLWLTFTENIMSETITGSTSAARSALAASDAEIPDDSFDFVSVLRKNSTALAISSLAIKSIFGLLSKKGIDASLTTFSSGSTADNYKFLFGSEQNIHDINLTTFSAKNADEFIAQVSLNSNTFSELNVNKTSARVSSSEEALSVTESIESDAYNFALQLATFAYEFTSQTETDAAEFASELANLAYQFTIDIEEDAYQFALQGMEYGYLFASMGEEVGIMADRILWMAVQIGVMADRIGEMADRIVYTEQLIVYTEMLILDFGILIYGVIKQITNLILSGMALILDREWYTAESEDIILDTISSNVNVMLQNMQEYSLTILDHQNELRQLTLDALDSVNFAEPAL